MPDVNILVHAHREDSPDHLVCRTEIEAMTRASASFGISPLALSGFMRVVTHPRVFDPPSPPDQAIAFCSWLRAHPQVLVIEPGARHWMIFIELIQLANCKGNLIPDAWFAALAIEHGAEWLTLDRDFARFPGLRWRFPEAAPKRSDM